MTDTNKPVTRVSLSAYGHPPRNLVVTIGPGDVVTIREKGRRASVTLPISWLYIQGMIRAADPAPRLMLTKRTT